MEIGNVKEIDLIAILANVLDNAIEECGRIKSEEKLIQLNCDMYAENIVIKVSNSTERNEISPEKVYTDKEDTYIFTDLLADVLIYPDGKVKVVDIGEIAEAMEKGIVDDALVKKALVRLDKLLDIIYAPDGLKNAVGKYMDMER